MNKYRAEVIADSSGKWAGNVLEFPTFKEAEAYACDLAFRWTLVEKARVVEFNGDNIINTTVVWGS